jgi:hypothetical protein
MFESQKTGESISVRESGLVVRKLVSIERNTLTGLKDLVEIAVERDLIQSEKARVTSKGGSQAMETLSRDGSPISASPPVITYCPVTFLPLFASRIRRDYVAQ